MKRARVIKEKIDSTSLMTLIPRRKMKKGHKVTPKRPQLTSS